MRSNYIFTDPAGTQHPFNLLVYLSGPCVITNGAETAYATDASGYFLDAKNGIVYAPDGTKFTFSKPATQDANGNFILQEPVVTDPNGNYFTGVDNETVGETDWKDSLGQTVLKITNQGTASNGGFSETDYGRLAVDGTYQTIAVKYEVASIRSNFGCTGVSEFSIPGGSLVSEIDLPNGQKYSFTYEPTPGFAGSVTGRLQQVKLPTGGTVNFQYAAANGGINCADGTLVNFVQTVNDGTNSATWNYTRVPDGTSGSKGGTTTVTLPQLPYDLAANQTVVTFDIRGHETSRKMYQGSASGTPLRTVNTTWTPGSGNNTPASRVVILEDGRTQSEVETNYDSNGNLLSMVEHDWGSGTPGPVLRTTTLSYLPGTNYTTRNIINRVQDKVVTDASGTVKSRTHIDYDQPNGINQLCPANAAQHDDFNYSCTFTFRGLPTAVTTYADAANSGGAITKNFQYDWFGNLISAQLDCCQLKQWTFSALTQYAFPDSIVSGPAGGTQLGTSATYYNTTGQIKTATDENSQVTTYTYNDPGHLDRLTDVQRPDNAHITYGYDDLNLQYTVSNPVQGTSVVKKITALDALGRPFTSTTDDAASTIYSVTQTQYDPLGRPYKSSNPYTASPQFWTTSQFDALGRPTLTLLPDGAQTTSSYSLTSATVSDPAGKQRKSLTNGIGQLSQVDEPGDAFGGTQASGTITIPDPLNTRSDVGATSGGGSFRIAGTEGFSVNCVRAPNGTVNCIKHYHTGSVSLTVMVGGTAITKNASYGQGSTPQTIANALAGQFSIDGNFQNVNVVANADLSYMLNVTAKAVGVATNYSYSALPTTGQDFSVTTAGATFTGGVDGQAVADAGTIALKIGSFTTAPVCYGTSCNSTASAVAGALAGALAAPGSPVGNIHVNGATISMTATQPSSAWNVAITATPASNDLADFPQGSFAAQGSLQGGADPYPSGLAHPNSTFYSYGIFDNLLQVTQGAQTRVYGYDDLDRLTDATTPEAGHVHYGYNSFGLMTQKTDARGVTTNYGYDTLNRLQNVSYDVGSTGIPATPAVTYQYGSSQAQNNNGRLLTVLDGLGSETYTYDNMGQIKQLDKVIAGTTYSIKYGYNLAGELTSLTYPSGRVVQQSFDAIGRLCEIAPQTTGCGTATAPYASSYSYNAAFEATGFSYGNGVNAGFGFSPDRLQLTSLTYKKGSSTLFGANYFYQQDSVNCPAGASGNNGQIQCITDLVDAGRSLSYGYDTLARLANVTSKGSAAYPQWGLSFSYDRYGNRTAQTVTAGSAPPGPSATVDPATNRLQAPYAYDASGNMTNDGVNALAYDAAGQVISSTAAGLTATYSYDCKSLRVKKISGGVTTVYIFSGGKVIAEYANGAAPTSPTREYIYSGATLLARIEGGSTTYYHPDHLSPRLLTDASGNITGQQGHFPFGEMWYDSGSKWKFTTYERDSESGNDYAIARYYVNRLGRFSAPDPVAGSMMNAQTLNRYSYVANDPINYHDPNGQFLTALTLFLDRAGFPNAWANFNELTLLDGDHFYQDGELMRLGGKYLLVGLIPADNIRDVAKNRLSGKCLEFILKTLQKAFDAQNDRSAASGYPPSASVLQSQKDATSGQSFSNTMMSASIIRSTQPDKEIPDADASAEFHTITLYPLFSQNPDQPETFIHETFHLAPYGFSDQEMANAVGAKYTTIPGNIDKTVANASAAWDQKLEKACGGQKKK
jgi:RHS repeat-associated protein